MTAAACELGTPDWRDQALCAQLSRRQRVRLQRAEATGAAVDAIVGAA